MLFRSITDLISSKQQDKQRIAGLDSELNATKLKLILWQDALKKARENENTLQAQVADMVEALEAIKSFVSGETILDWINKTNITHSRAAIANVCDKALSTPTDRYKRMVEALEAFIEARPKEVTMEGSKYLNTVNISAFIRAHDKAVVALAGGDADNGRDW